MHLFNKSHLCLIALLFIITASTHALEAKKTSVSEYDGYSLVTGLEYENGDYGTSDSTDLWRVPIGLRYRSGQYTVGIDTSFLSAKSTGTIITSTKRNTMMKTVPSTDLQKITSAKPGVNSASGIGDIEMFASYRLPTQNDSKFRSYVSLFYKLGTADADKGLGTGENDYGIEGGLFTRYKEVILTASLGYQVNGDSATINYDNVWYTDLGVIYPVKDDRSLGAILSLSQSATAGYDSPMDITLFLDQELDKKRDLNFYLQFGLSDGSPDFGIGANITFKL